MTVWLLSARALLASIALLMLCCSTRVAGTADKIVDGLGVKKKGMLIGKDKLNGKFGGKDLFLSGPLVGGKLAQGGSVLGLSTAAKGGALPLLVDRKVDGVFGGLLTASPFTFDPASKKKGLFSKKPINKKIGLKKKKKEGAKKGLASKLSFLNQALGGGTGDVLSQAVEAGAQGAAVLGNAVDSTVGNVEQMSRLGLEAGLAYLDSNPETANMKNMIFQTLLFGLFVDSGLNARKSVLETCIGRVKGYKKIFKPLGADSIFDAINGRFSRSIAIIDRIQSIPQTIFRASSENGDNPGTIGTVIRNFRREWDNLGFAVTNAQVVGYEGFSNFLRDVERSQATSTTDEGLDWLIDFRRDTQDGIDQGVLDAERLLNEWVNLPNEAINQALTTLFESGRLGSFDGDLGLTDPRDTLNRLRSTTDRQFDGVRDLFSSGLDLYSRGQQAALDTLVSEVRGALDGRDVGSGSISSLLDVDGDSLSRAFDRALSLSRDGGTQFLELAGDAGSLLDSIVGSAADSVGDRELGSLIRGSVDSFNIQDLFGALDGFPSINLPRPNLI